VIGPTLYTTFYLKLIIPPLILNLPSSSNSRPVPNEIGEGNDGAKSWTTKILS